ncbi:MAG TPA: hypothetical protein VFT65_00735 [Candidatus Angelobacter sp.]|nr:hypothetical protein [Candidatus Angelobacter sp.]
MRTLIPLLSAAFALTLFCRTASAHDGRPHSESAQAQLHINVILVPAVQPPHHRERHDRDDAAVTYNLSPAADNYSVSEETRKMVIDANGSNPTRESVQVTTVVLK